MKYRTEAARIDKLIALARTNHRLPLWKLTSEERSRYDEYREAVERYDNCRMKALGFDNRYGYRISDGYREPPFTMPCDIAKALNVATAAITVPANYTAQQAAEKYQEFSAPSRKGEMR